MVADLLDVLDRMSAGNARHLTGNLSDAGKPFRDLLVVDPERPSAHSSLADGLRKKGRLEEALPEVALAGARER